MVGHFALTYAGSFQLHFVMFMMECFFPSFAHCGRIEIVLDHAPY